LGSQKFVRHVPIRNGLKEGVTTSPLHLTLLYKDTRRAWN